jgi:UDP-N-acetylglucosamine transferase subunit ALG13
MLSPEEFNRIFDDADLIITHAGMGIILKSLVANKPIIVLPRKLELNEHTTDHQMATAAALEKMEYVEVAWDNEQLSAYLEKPETIRSKKTLGSVASGPIITALKDFIRKH